MSLGRVVGSLICASVAVGSIAGTASAWESDCTMCGRETGFVPSEEVRLVVDETVWLDIEPDCIMCGRETGFLPKSGWTTALFPVEAGRTYELIMTPYAGTGSFYALTPDGKLACAGDAAPITLQVCQFTPAKSGKLIVDLNGTTDVLFDLQIHATK